VSDKLFRSRLARVHLQAISVFGKRRVNHGWDAARPVPVKRRQANVVQVARTKLLKRRTGDAGFTSICARRASQTHAGAAKRFATRARANARRLARPAR
jgi:hypothetical protein